MLAQIGSLQNRIASLSASQGSENATIVQLQSEVSQLQSEVSQLQQEILQLQQELNHTILPGPTITETTTEASPLTACPSVSETTPLGPIPTISSAERKIVSASDLVWEFYTNGTSIVYRSSADGTTWSAPAVVISDAVRAYWFTVYQSTSNSNKVWFAFASSEYGPPIFEYGNGTLNSDGTISWSQPFLYGYTTGTVPNTPSLTADSSGHLWLAMETYQPDGTRHIEVYRMDPSWTKVFDVGGLVEWPHPILTPLSSGGMALSIVTMEGQLQVYSTSNGGASWAGPTNSSSDYQDISAVSAGAAVYYAGVTMSGILQEWSFSVGTGLSAPTPLLPSGDFACGATISTDGGSSLAVVFSDSSTVMMTTSTDLGGIWTTPRLVSFGDVDIEPTSLTSDYFINGNVMVMWSDASLSTGIYQVATAIVPFQGSIVNP